MCENFIAEMITKPKRRKSCHEIIKKCEKIQKT